MSKLVRLLACALLAAFAAGSVVQAASATTMALKMAFAGSGAMDMAGCEGCGSGDNAGDGGLACQAACLAPLAAILSQETALAPLPGASPASSAVGDVGGRTAPPEPHPPRTLI